MADLKITGKYSNLYAGANIRQGMVVYRAERKGLRAKIARFIYRHFGKLERYAYELLPAIREDEFKRPIGIAIDEKTILVSGTLNMPNIGRDK